jgi:hypothetical protein
MDVYLRYVGQGFLPGVPARDLNQAEAVKFGVSRLVNSGLYVKVRQPASKPSPSTDKALPGGAENKGE